MSSTPIPTPPLQAMSSPQPSQRSMRVMEVGLALVALVVALVLNLGR